MVVFLNNASFREIHMFQNIKSILICKELDQTYFEHNVLLYNQTIHSIKQNIISDRKQNIIKQNKNDGRGVKTQCTYV